MKHTFHSFSYTQKIIAVLLIVTMSTNLLAAWQLQITEVYVDGTDEWIEIANIGTSDFNEALTLSGARTSNNLLHQSIYIPAGEVRVIADEMTSFLDTSRIVAGVNKFSISDTQAVNIDLLVSGVFVDQWTVAASQMLSVDNMQTALERLQGSIVPVDIARVSNVVSGFVANPGLFGMLTGLVNSGSNQGGQGTGTGNNQTGQTISGNNQTGAMLSGLDYCPLLSGTLSSITIAEIHPVQDQLPVYIELMGNANYGSDLIISGTALHTPILLSGLILIPGQRVLLVDSMNGLQHTQDVRQYNIDVYESGTIELYTTNDELIDVIHFDSSTLSGGQSLYASGASNCFRQFHAIGSASPGFDEVFLAYMNTQIVTQTIYLTQTGTTTTTSCDSGGGNGGNTSIGGPTTGGTTSGNANSNGFAGSLAITLIDYDPPGTDTNNERIGITMLSGTSALNLADGRYLRYDNKTRYFTHGSLSLGQEQIITDNYVFVNSRSVCIDLMYSGQVFDTECYDPSSQVSPVIPGQTQPQSPVVSSGQTTELTNYRLTLGDIVYDPLGTDTNSEQITIISGEPQAIDLTDFRIRINGSNKRIDRVIQPFETLTVTKTRGLSNSTATCVELILGEQVFDEKCYDPTVTVAHTSSGEVSETESESIFLGDITITDIMYDPPGTDKDNESMLLAVSGSSIDFSQGWSIYVNGRKKTLKSFGIYTEGAIHLTGNFAFPNTKGTCVDIYQYEKLFDTYCYTYSKQSLTLTTQTGTTGDSVIKDLSVRIVSVLPNPLGKDSDRESITVLVESWPEAFDVDKMTLTINGRNKNFSGLIQGSDYQTIFGSWGLPNDKSCISLTYEGHTLDQFCYTKPKEGVVYSDSDQLLESIPEDTLAILRAIKHKNTATEVCSTYQGFSLLCSKKPKIKVTKVSSQELRIARAYISLLEQELKSERYVLRKHSVLSEYASIYRQALASAKAGNKLTVIDGVAVDVDALELQHTLRYNRSDEYVVYEALMDSMFSQ